jgi:hypothetical protein
MNVYQAEHRGRLGRAFHEVIGGRLSTGLVLLEAFPCEAVGGRKDSGCEGWKVHAWPIPEPLATAQPPGWSTPSRLRRIQKDWTDAAIVWPAPFLQRVLRLTSHFYPTNILPQCLTLRIYYPPMEQLGSDGGPEGGSALHPKISMVIAMTR